jgi:hypothetical protein
LEETRKIYSARIPSITRLFNKPLTSYDVKNKQITKKNVSKQKSLPDIYTEYDDEKLMNDHMNDHSGDQELLVSNNSSTVELETLTESVSIAPKIKKCSKKPRGGYTRWSEDFKASIIEEVQKTKIDINELSRKKGVPKKNIGRWLKFGPQRKKG